METIRVIKIGGNIVDDAVALARFVKNFAALPSPKILVHGGGKEATRLSTKLEIPTTMIEGRRVTDRDTLDVCTMVYAGLTNKRIVSLLQKEGCNAIGLSGADANIVKAVKREAKPIDYGYVGDIVEVNSEAISSLFSLGMTPVVCAIMHDGAGNLLNCNADSVASAIASGVAKLGKTELTFCFEQAGVMENISRQDSLIEQITPNIYADLRDRGIVNKGMIPKIDNAFAAIDAGVSQVRIMHADAILSGRGTTISK